MFVCFLICNNIGICFKVVKFYDRVSDVFKKVVDVYYNLYSYFFNYY